MKKLILASLAAATLLVGAGLTQSANAAVQCWFGPLGILRHCAYTEPLGPAYYLPPPVSPPYYYYYYSPYVGY
jgi:hypothetical protein